MSAITIPLRQELRPLTEEQRQRYLRNFLVTGIDIAGQERICAAKVLVIGAGGLGSPVITYLAAAGVGTIGICDSDVVEIHNLQRQVIHSMADLAQPKVQSAKKWITGLNPDVQVQTYPHVTRKFLQQELAQWDLVVECTDNFNAKFLVADECAAAGVPLVWGTVVGLDYQISVFWSQPPQGVTPTHLRMLFPEIPANGTTPASTEVGVLGPVVGITGSTMAVEALKLVAGFGEPLFGKILVGNARTHRVEVVPYQQKGL